MEAARERESCDLGLLCAVLFLLVVGTALVLDASYVQAAASHQNPFFFFFRQAGWAAMALVTLYLGLRVPYSWLRGLSFPALGVSIVLLLLVLIPHVGKELNGARRWLGAGPLSFQPSEFAKIALVLFLARYSEVWRGRIQHLTKGFAPAVMAIGVVGILVAKEDLGTAITIIATGLLMLLMMGARPRHMAALVGLALFVGVALVRLEPYRMDRIWAWRDVLTQPLVAHQGPAYQPSQGLIALGSGGLFGHGIMQGSAKHLYLPVAYTDYIFATVGEEVGLFGCLLLLGMFALLVVRGLTIAHRSRDWYASLVAAGLTCVIGVQALLNVAVVTCVVPCTGVPLPFISYGGSSLLFTTLAAAIVLGISQYPNGVGAGVDGREGKTRESRADGWRDRRPHLSRT
jgi:cell division protein FtsW